MPIKRGFPVIPTSRLGKQLSEAIDALNRLGAPFALIGGLALASHGVIRATQDIDLLVNLDDAERIEDELERLGYVCLHRSSDAGNYARDDERLDLLYASRPIARRLLMDAADHNSSLGRLRVVSPEGLIAFKLQALFNNPRRTQDLEDIRALLRGNRTGSTSMKSPGTFAFSTGSRCSMSFCERSTDQPIAGSGGLERQVEKPPNRDPFVAFDDLMTVVEALCPKRPERESSLKSGIFLL